MKALTKKDTSLASKPASRWKPRLSPDRQQSCAKNCTSTLQILTLMWCVILHFSNLWRCHTDIIFLCCKNIFCVEKQLMRPSKRWYLLMSPCIILWICELLFPFKAGVDTVTPTLVSVPTFTGSETVILSYATSMSYLAGLWMLSMWILKNCHICFIYMSFYMLLVLYRLAKVNVSFLNI